LIPVFIPRNIVENYGQVRKPINFYYHMTSCTTPTSSCILLSRCRSFHLIRNHEKSKQISLKSSSEISPTLQPHPLLQHMTSFWGKSWGNQREIRKSRTPKSLVADPSGLPDECDTSEGSYSFNLISCSQCTTEKTFWLEAISSTFLLAVQENSVSYIVDEVHAFIVDTHSL